MLPIKIYLTIELLSHFFCEYLSVNVFVAHTSFDLLFVIQRARLAVDNLHHLLAPSTATLVQEGRAERARAEVAKTLFKELLQRET